MSQDIVIAKITAPFGIKGEVKMVIYSDEIENIAKYPLFDAAQKQFKIKIKNNKVIGTSSGNPIVIARIEGVDDRNKSEDLRGVEIFTNRENFKQTNEDEFYYIDLIGLDVIDEKSQKIGKVLNVFDHGAGGILEIEFSDKKLSKNYDKINNFSFKNEIFPEVNLKEGFVKMILPDLVEDDLKEESV